MADRDLLERIDEHMARGNELMEEIREERRLNRQEHRLNREEHRLNRAAMQEMRNFAREVVLELREHLEVPKDVRHGFRLRPRG